MTGMRLRDLGITIGLLPPGPLNAITDVAGVRVGHTTLIEGEGSLVAGSGPIRTGVTAIVPHDGSLWTEAVYAGSHRLNGNGEMTGLEWIRETGLLSGPIAITNTNSVGVVRDAIVQLATRDHAGGSVYWALPVVAETWDGWLNDIEGMHVRPEHLFAAVDGATGGPVPEGNVGGGTGMICHEFKGGIGTASRRVPAEDGGFTVGVLVQANYGGRRRLAIDGVQVGRQIGFDEVPSAWDAAPRSAGAGSIIVIVATDAPLLPHQCQRLAQRATLGIARAGGNGANSSGDLALAFSTGNRGLAALEPEDAPLTRNLVAVDDARMDQLFWGAIEATEEAIANALVAAETMTGRDGHVAHALPPDRLREVVLGSADPAARRSEPLR
jgi:D-aminopeptidase